MSEQQNNNEKTYYDSSLWSDINAKRSPDPRGLGSVIFDEMKKHEHMIAQIDAESGVSETHGELRLRGIIAAQEMRSRGITSDDVISICSESNMDCFVAFLAAVFIGAKVAPLDPLLSVKESVYMIRLVEPKLIFCCSQSVELMEESIKKSGINVDLVVFGDTTDHIKFSAFQNVTGKEQEFVPKVTNDIYETAMILFTSGTTGLAKGICLTHFGLLYQTIIYTQRLRIMSYTRLYWISATLTFLRTVFGGGCRIIVKNFDPRTVFKYLHKYKVEFLFLSPYYAYKLTEKPEYKTHKLPNLKMLFMGGGLIHEAQIMKLRSFLPDTVINMGYGLTETTAAGTKFVPPQDLELIEMKPTSCGRITEGVNYKVIDIETNESVGPYCYGELYLKTPAIMNGYYRNTEETSKAFDNEGYFKTGDIVYYDEDGCFYFIDRIKELMKYQSWHITPGELEQILLEHPDVKECVVVSLPSEVDGDLPLGIVVLREGCKCSEEALVKHVDGKVPDYKRLRGGVRFVKEIPLTPTGKYKRRELKNMVINNII